MEISMLFLIAGVLILFWFGGLFFRIAGGFIHILLVIAFLVILFSFFMGHSGSP